MDFSDFYSLLYGHHMAGEAMFGVLPRFQEKEYFDSHRKGILYTPEKTYNIKIFASVYTDAYDRYVFDPVNRDTSTKKEELVEYIKEKAV